MKVLVLLLIIFSSHVFADEEYSVGGVKIGMTINEAIAVKGQPDKLIEILDWFDHEYHFKRLKVYSLGTQEVVGLESSDVNDCTHDKICPKDNISKATKILGLPSNVVKEDNGSLQIFSKPGTYCSYQFLVNNEIIESVNVACSPD